MIYVYVVQLFLPIHWIWSLWSLGQFFAQQLYLKVEMLIWFKKMCVNCFYWENSWFNDYKLEHKKTSSSRTRFLSLKLKNTKQQTLSCFFTMIQRACKRSFKRSSMQWWQCPIHNSTLKSFVSSRMNYSQESNWICFFSTFNFCVVYPCLKKTTMYYPQRKRLQRRLYGIYLLLFSRSFLNAYLFCSLKNHLVWN